MLLVKRGPLYSESTHTVKSCFLSFAILLLMVGQLRAPGPGGTFGAETLTGLTRPKRETAFRNGVKVQMV